MFRLLYTLSAVLSVLILLPLLVSAHLIEVSAGKKECFFEDLHVHDKVHMHSSRSWWAQVGHVLDDCIIPSRRRGALRYRLLGSYLSIWDRQPFTSWNHQLSDPHSKTLGKHVRQDTGSVSITAETDGRHEYCFSNVMSAIADKIVRYVCM